MTLPYTKSGLRLLSVLEDELDYRPDDAPGPRTLVTDTENEAAEDALKRLEFALGDLDLRGLLAIRAAAIAVDEAWSSVSLWNAQKNRVLGNLHAALKEASK